MTSQTESQNVWAAVWRSMRPGQWQKNLIAYAPLLFSAGSGWDPADGAEAARLFTRASIAVVLLCLAASGGYLLNDARDVVPGWMPGLNASAPNCGGKSWKISASI